MSREGFRPSSAKNQNKYLADLLGFIPLAISLQLLVWPSMKLGYVFLFLPNSIRASLFCNFMVSLYIDGARNDLVHPVNLPGIGLLPNSFPAPQTQMYNKEEMTDAVALLGGSCRQEAGQKES